MHVLAVLFVILGLYLCSGDHLFHGSSCECDPQQIAVPGHWRSVLPGLGLV